MGCAGIPHSIYEDEDEEHVCSRRYKCGRKSSDPPYSLFIGRGDLQHAGAGSQNYPFFNTFPARMHGMYFPAEEEFPNAISFVHNYNPKFAGDMDSDSSASEAPNHSSVEEEARDDSSDQALEVTDSNQMEDESPPPLREQDGDEEDPSVDVENDKSDEEFMAPPVSRKRSRAATSSLDSVDFRGSPRKSRKSKRSRKNQ